MPRVRVWRRLNEVNSVLVPVTYCKYQIEYLQHIPVLRQIF